MNNRTTEWNEFKNTELNLIDSEFDDAYNAMTLINSKAISLSGVLGDDEVIGGLDHVQLAECAQIVHDLLNQAREAQRKLADKFNNFKSKIIEHVDKSVMSSA